MAKEGSPLTAGTRGKALTLLGLAPHTHNRLDSSHKLQPHSPNSSYSYHSHLKQKRLWQYMLRGHLWIGFSMNMVAADHRGPTSQRNPVFSEGWPSVHVLPSSSPLHLALGVPQLLGPGIYCCQAHLETLLLYFRATYF